MQRRVGRGSHLHQSQDGLLIGGVPNAIGRSAHLHEHPRQFKPLITTDSLVCHRRCLAVY